MKLTNVARLVFLVLALQFAGFALAGAQTAPVPPPVAPPPASAPPAPAGGPSTLRPVPSLTPAAPATGAFDRLSPGNQKIARALFEAQQRASTPGSGTSGTSAVTPLTLDQIAELRLSGQGWGQAFKTMQSRGLVQEKNLGQVVSRYSRRHGGARGEVTTATNRPLGADRGPGKAVVDDGDDRSGRSDRAGHRVHGYGSGNRGDGHPGAGGNNGGWSGGGQGRGAGHGGGRGR